MTRSKRRACGYGANQLNRTLPSYSMICNPWQLSGRNSNPPCPRFPGPRFALRAVHRGDRNRHAHAGSRPLRGHSPRKPSPRGGGIRGILERLGIETWGEEEMPIQARRFRLLGFPKTHGSHPRAASCLLSSSAFRWRAPATAGFAFSPAPRFFAWSAASLCVKVFARSRGTRSCSRPPRRKGSRGPLRRPADRLFAGAGRIPPGGRRPRRRP
jgi:hypothetical protein